MANWNLHVFCTVLRTKKSISFAKKEEEEADEFRFYRKEKKK